MDSHFSGDDSIPDDWDSDSGGVPFGHRLSDGPSVGVSSSVDSNLGLLVRSSSVRPPVGLGLVGASIGSTTSSVSPPV